MKCNINDVEWEICEVEADSPELHLGSGACGGTTYFRSKKIFIANNLCADEKRKTVSHELAHAFLYETQLEEKESFTEENLCDFVGIYGAQINNICFKYFYELAEGLMTGGQKNDM